MRVALSWRSSLFLLEDSDSGPNREQGKVLAPLKADLLHDQGKVASRGTVSRWKWGWVDCGTSGPRSPEGGRRRPPRLPVFPLPPRGSGPSLSQMTGFKRAVSRSVLFKRCLFSQRIFSRLSWEVPGGRRCAARRLSSARLPCPSALPSSSRCWRPHCWGSPRPSGSSGRALRLLSIISLQLSLQECSRLRGGGRARCWLWQQVNKMCSQLGVSSWPGRGGREPIVPNLVICTPSP